MEIESSIPGSFIAGDKLWRTEGEGLLMSANIYVTVMADQLDAEEARKLKECIEGLSADYYIEFDGKRFSGKS